MIKLIAILFLVWPAYSLELGHGINTFPWLYRIRTSPGDATAFIYKDAFPYRSQYAPEIFKNLKAMNVDFVRVPLEPTPFLNATAADRATLIESVLAEINKATRAGLKVIVDFHPRETYPQWGTAAILGNADLFKKYQDSLVAVAKALNSVAAGKIWLELMNEPAGGWSGSELNPWLKAQPNLVKLLRSAAPSLHLIVTGDRGGGIDGLLRLNPSDFDDPSLVYSFHFYESMVFTHQGADWGSRPWRKYMSGAHYPASGMEATLKALRDRIFAAAIPESEKKNLWVDAEPTVREYYQKDKGAETIKVRFAQVSDWAKRYGISPARILLGEFGVLRPGADHDSAINYLYDVRCAAEAAGFNWAVFNFQPQDENGRGFSLLRMDGDNPNAFDSAFVEHGMGWKSVFGIQSPPRVHE